MNNRFYDLTFETLGSGAIRLRQSAFDEDRVIDLHIQQVLFVARSICETNPETTNKVADLERRIAVLTDKLQNIVCGRLRARDKGSSQLRCRCAQVERRGDAGAVHYPASSDDW